MSIQTVAERAREIVRGLQDRSLLSPELRPHLGLWDVEVLLSAERANLLRPVRELLQGRVLEWNAGAGTLTRYLGELGLAVTAFEADATLAETAALRCADLGNVKMTQQAPAAGERFDVIVATGVTPEDVPRLRAYGGVLLLAADNALSMSVLAGAPYSGEDARLRVAGKADWLRALPEARFLYPFPDLRLPSLVLSEAAFQEPRFDAATLIRSALAGSPGFDQMRSFSEEQMWVTAVRSGLGEMLAPSFLIVSGGPLATDTFAFKYSTRRAPAYQKAMRIVRRGSEIAVERESLTDQAAVSHRVLDEPYHQGGVYFDRLLDIVNRRGWTVSEIIAWAEPWIEYLRARATSDGLLPRELFDCLPSNLVVQGDRFESFDLEYAPDAPPRLAQVIFRGVLSSLSRLRNCEEPTPRTPPRLMRIATQIAEISDEEAERFLQAEAAFQGQVGGSDPAEVSKQLRTAMLPVRAGVDAALAHRRTMLEQIETYHEAVEQASAEMTELHKRLTHYHEKMDLISAANTELTDELTDYHRKMEGASGEIRRLHATLGDYHHHVLNIEALRAQEREQAEVTAARLKEVEQEAEALRTQAARLPELETEAEALRREFATADQQLKGLQQPLTRLRVLYVTDMLSAPFRYRCENAVLQLRQDGVTADLAMADHPGLVKRIGEYSVVVLFRLQWNQDVAALVSEARRLHVSLVFDIDDLLFEGSLSRELPFLARKPFTDRLQYHDVAARVRETMLACDWFIGSTPALVEAAQPLRPAFEYPNLLPPELVRQAPRIRRLTALARRHRIIGYLSGSDTHDLDLQSILPALVQVLKKDPSVYLLLGGFLHLPEEVAAFGGQVIRTPFFHWKVLPWLQAMLTVNLAPLAEVNRFTESKSPLKFFEAAILGVPTVATPTGPLSAAIRHGKNGFLAETEENWVAAIRGCLNRKTNRRVGQAARETALQQFTFEAHRGELRQLLRRFVQERWKEPSYEQPALPLHGMLHDVPSGTMEEFFGIPARDQRWIRWLMGAALSPARLDLRQWWEPPYIKVVPGCADPGTLYEVNAGIPPEVLEHSAAIELKQWTWNDEVQPDGDQLVSSGEDPYLVSEPCRFQSENIRFAKVTLRLPNEGGTDFGRVYWGGERNEFFEEEFAISFPVYLDGRIHTYIIDLSQWERGGRTRWLESGTIRILRFDPMTRPGRFEFTFHGLF